MLVSFSAKCRIKAEYSLILTLEYSQAIRGWLFKTSQGSRKRLSFSCNILTQIIAGCKQSVTRKHKYSYRLLIQPLFYRIYKNTSYLPGQFLHNTAAAHKQALVLVIVPGCSIFFHNSFTAVHVLDTGTKINLPQSIAPAPGLSYLWLAECHTRRCVLPMKSLEPLMGNGKCWLVSSHFWKDHNSCTRFF